MGRQITNLDNRFSQADLWGNSFIVDLEWTLSDDLDLAALCISKEGNNNSLIYHGSVGKRAAPPYVHLAHESDGDGRMKLRREHLVITRSNANSAILIFVWDHAAVASGSWAEFLRKQGSYSISVTDQRNHRIQLHSSAAAGNCLLVGQIRDSHVSSCGRATTVEEASHLSWHLADLAGVKAEIQPCR